MGPQAVPFRQPLVRVAQRCWLPSDHTTDFVALCAAALESSAAHTVVASVSAARLHGLWLPRVSGVVHLASADPTRAGRNMTRTRRSPLVAHRFQLRAQDVVLVQGLPVTSLARTWRDLAQYLSLPDLVAAGDSALRAGAHRADMDELAKSMRHAPRAIVLRQALELLDERSRSRPESHLRVAVAGLTVVRFGVNEPVYRDEGGWLAEPDLSLPAAKLALEYQGSDHAEAGRMRRDLSRFRDLRDEAWLALPYGPTETFGHPDQIRAEVRREVWNRAPELLVRPSRQHNRRR